MTIALLTLSGVCIWNVIDLVRLEKRMAKLEAEMPAKIDQARNEGWLDGVLYQAEVEKRRHPRDPKTKQFVKR